MNLHLLIYPPILMVRVRARISVRGGLGLGLADESCSAGNRQITCKQRQLIEAG